MGVTNVSTWATSAILGAAFHAGTQWLEPDLIVPQTAACLAVLALAGVYVDVQVFDKPLVDTATTLAIVTFGFLLSLTVSTLVYRVFFHRLRKFPGPFAAKLSKFYSLYLSRNLQYHFEAEKLHKKYGDVVRTGPRELSIARISPLNQIITCQKTNFYTMTESRKEAQGLSFKDDIEDHRRARRAWDISLTPAQISKYNAAMQSTITLFLDRLAEPERVGKPVNITDWISWLGYDIMGVVGFGRDFGCLRNAKGHPAIKTLQDFGFMLGLLKHVPWLGNILTRIPGGGGAMAPYARYCKSLVREKIAALSSKTTKPDAPTDVVSWLIKAFEEKKPYAASSIEALDDDARALVIGGATTPMRSPTDKFNPRKKLQTLRNEDSPLTEITQEPTCKNCSTRTISHRRRDSFDAGLCNVCAILLNVHGRMRPSDRRAKQLKAKGQVSSKTRLDMWVRARHWRKQEKSSDLDSQAKSAKILPTSRAGPSRSPGGDITLSSAEVASPKDTHEGHNSMNREPLKPFSKLDTNSSTPFTCSDEGVSHVAEAKGISEGVKDYIIDKLVEKAYDLLGYNLSDVSEGRSSPGSSSDECRQTFQSASDLVRHLARADRCVQVVVPQQEDGLDEDQVQKLRSRDRGVDPEDKWRHIYRICHRLLDDAETPSPYCDQESPADQAVEGYDWYQRQHLPGLIRQQLEQEPDITEFVERFGERLPAIIRACQDNLHQRFISPRASADSAGGEALSAETDQPTVPSPDNRAATSSAPYQHPGALLPVAFEAAPNTDDGMTSSEALQVHALSSRRGDRSSDSGYGSGVFEGHPLGPMPDCSLGQPPSGLTCGSQDSIPPKDSSESGPSGVSWVDDIDWTMFHDNGGFEDPSSLEPDFDFGGSAL
ncbi:hypothetical protein SLS55_002797 [Diplodia seriata]|uniref:GATA-type domain-containing protein n=1 Tax=Diplodia seriata TaxID=420778 RepID=A0ABR3CL67_9PEZI